MSDQLRFNVSSGRTDHEARNLSNELYNKEIRFYQVFTPRYDPRAVIFMFSHTSEKEKLLNLENLNEILRKCNCTLHSPGSNDPKEKSDRSIFLWNLSPGHFICYTIEDGNDVDETLDSVMLNMVNDIKEEVGKRGMQILEHHFIQHRPQDNPRGLKLTFCNIDQAKKFLAEDTSIRSGVLLARFKKQDVHIPIKQCKICRMTNHRAGDRNCRGTPRCPRCTSRDHTQPTMYCQPKCFSCGEGHSPALTDAP